MPQDLNIPTSVLGRAFARSFSTPPETPEDSLRKGDGRRQQFQGSAGSLRTPVEAFWVIGDHWGPDGPGLAGARRPSTRSDIAGDVRRLCPGRGGSSCTPNYSRGCTLSRVSELLSPFFLFFFLSFFVKRLRLVPAGGCGGSGRGAEGQDPVTESRVCDATHVDGRPPPVLPARPPWHSEAAGLWK